MLLHLVGRREQLDHGRIIGPELGLRHALPPAPALASELWLLTHPGLRRSARVRALMDSLGWHSESADCCRSERSGRQRSGGCPGPPASETRSAG
ncbi:MAG: hypothetical protein K0R41_1800 [Geminicoccaceae bacterium]|jgi:hypothetical protein|nr:hypothetical protein [Geminicoccaceae bacterium]